jgi:hypothetical protein
LPISFTASSLEDNFLFPGRMHMPDRIEEFSVIRSNFNAKKSKKLINDIF